MASARHLLVGLVITFVSGGCTAVAPMEAGDSPRHPLRAYGPVPEWARTPTVVAPSATPLTARAEPDAIVHTETGTRIVVRAVRDNDGRVWLTRRGTAVWTRISGALVLRGLDGSELERLEDASDLRESMDGSTRAYSTREGWVVEAGGRRVRIAEDVRFPSLSADGRYLAYERVGATTRDVVVLDVGSGEEAVVAGGIGRCRCTNVVEYGFPRWASTAASITYRDGGLFDAPPEERSGGDFTYDVTTGRTKRVALRSPDGACFGVGTLVSADSRYVLTYSRSCGLRGP